MRRVAAVLFPGFEMLDLFGPLEMLSILADDFSITLVAEDQGPVPASGGPECLATLSFAECSGFEMVLVPGGRGTRREVANEAMTGFLTGASARAEVVASVCTGAALLASAGLLEGRKATTNKKAWAWATGTAPSVAWQPKARWVADGRFWTSSGVAAGMDMTLALIAELIDVKTAEDVANHTEYDWHRDSTWDPFAVLYGLA